MVSPEAQRRSAQRIKATLSPEGPTHAHPVLAAMQFAHATNTAGGATQYLRTGHMLEPGQPGIMMGGERDNRGLQVPTEKIPGHMSTDQALQQRFRLKARASDHSAALGAWRDSTLSDPPAEVDLSRIHTLRRAKKLAAVRKEKAGYDNETGKDIRFDR